MSTLVEAAANLVSSHAARSPMTTDELIAEIAKVHSALKKLEAGESLQGKIKEETPAHSVKDSIKKNEIVCLVCGKGGFKTLARHLGSVHGMKPGEYKKQFGIPAKQALSAKSYSESRRKMAEERGLADNLARAREVRQAKIEAKRKPAKAEKAAKSAKTAKAAAPAARKAGKGRAAGAKA